MKNRSPELLRDLTDKATALAVEQVGLDREAAARLARALVDMMRKDWGGQLIYFPKGQGIDLTERDLEFYNRWNGTTEHLEQLSAEYNVSIQWAYQIIKAVRSSDLARRQPDMFTSDPT